jgi:Fe-S-cluster-containing hydrogenase component 2
MGLQVNSVTRVTDAQCIGCLECVAACPSRDALAVTVSLPFPSVRAVPPTVDDDAVAMATTTTGAPEGALR